MQATTEVGLAPYATYTANSRGRKHPEAEHPFRSAYTRDRDRIVHSSAFRRLESKTQVFSYFENDYYRTRLTHTIEVAQISRTLTRLLQLNAEVAEAVALSHDLGHPPFGHAGEEALNQFLADKGTETGDYVFNHNIQGLRIVDVLESKYRAFLGLNLSFEIREAFGKHGSGRDHRPTEFAQTGPEPVLEAQIADLSDSIAYTAHDLDDGLLSGLITWDQVIELPWIGDTVRALDLPIRSEPEISRNELVRQMINYYVTDAYEATLAAIRRSGVQSAEDVRQADPLATLSQSASATMLPLRSFLRAHLYKHPSVLLTSSKATHIILSLCRAFYEDPERLPLAWSLTRGTRLPDTPRAVRVVDYVASLTDKSAVEIYKQLFDPGHGIHR